MTKVWSGKLKQFPMALVVTDIIDRIKSFPVGRRMSSAYFKDGIGINLEIYPSGHREEDADKLAIGLKFIGLSFKFKYHIKRFLQNYRRIICKQ